MSPFCHDVRVAYWGNVFIIQKPSDAWSVNKLSIEAIVHLNSGANTEREDGFRPWFLEQNIANVLLHDLFKHDARLCLDYVDTNMPETRHTTKPFHFLFHCVRKYIRAEVGFFLVSALGFPVQRLHESSRKMTPAFGSSISRIAPSTGKKTSVRATTLNFPQHMKPSLHLSHHCGIHVCIMICAEEVASACRFISSPSRQLQNEVPRA